MSAQQIIDAWNAINQFLPLSSVMTLVVVGSVLAFTVKHALNLFRGRMR